MQSAQVAAKALDGDTPITIIDSLSASMGVGNLVLHAARRARGGASIGEIVAEVEDRRDRSHLLFTVDTLEYLRKGGRIGGAQAFLGSMLSIKPIITVHEGVVEPAGRVRTRSKALRFIIDRIPAGHIELISVVHAQAPDLDEFLAMLEPVVPGAEVVVGSIGPVVGVHTGPRVIGVTWIQRPE
jgi:DegV family protein with EDD domain